MVLGQIALAGKDLLPAPRTGPDDHSLLLEHEFNGELTADGVPLSGAIDVINLRLNEGVAALPTSRRRRTSTATPASRTTCSRPRPRTASK
jgi:hypothetical protein